MSSKCHCIECIEIFTKAYSSTHFQIQDFSKWVENNRYEKPESFEVLVTTGNWKKVPIIFNTDGVNLITTEYFDGNKELSVLPGGVWEFEINSCENNWTLYRINDYRIRCQIEKLIYANKDPEIIKSIISDLDLVHSAVRFGEFRKASKLLEIINDKIEYLDCDDCKGC